MCSYPRQRSILVSWFIVAAGASSAEAQSRPVELAPPDATSSQAFSLLRGARELADGRLLVTDWLEQRIARIDFASGTVEDRGRLGAGPDEFRLPGALFPFRGDSSVLVDLGNGRLAVLDGDGHIRRTFAPSHPAAVSAGAIDASGNLYFTVPAWMADEELAGDSVSLMRLGTAGRRADSIARIRGNAMLTTPAPEMRIPFIVFAPQDSWVATRSGRIAIVRSSDYSIEWLGADGNRVRGQSNAGRLLPATTAERRAFVRRFAAASPVGGRGSEGLTLAPAELASDEAVERLMRASTFAETLPHFRPGEVWADGRERVWVGRSVAEGEKRIYDVFGGDGNRITTIRLGANRHLLTVGRAHLYIVVTDSDGLQTVERVPMPGAITTR